ncbi:MAG: MerR family transcriptional regulator [Oliverpabstia sp.]
MRTVNEVSKLTGVSVRTLHYYDKIGLLKPTKMTEAGYRLYDDTALKRLQNILMFREVRFPLKEIRKILDSPDFDAEEALKQQIKLLELQYRHIGELIAYAREIQEKGVDTMSLHVFDNTEMNQYKEEVREKWGQTKAYQEYKEKAKCGMNYQEAANEMMSLFAEIGKLRDLSPDHERVQEKIRDLQDFITEHYYNCTDEIFRDLGKMYVSDERFKKNIDTYGGEGTAEFTRNAIEKRLENQ